MHIKYKYCIQKRRGLLSSAFLSYVFEVKMKPKIKIVTKTRGTLRYRTVKMTLTVLSLYFVL
jgi:hypothetical protein